MNFVDIWPGLVLLLLASIAYRLYKIQDIVSGRAKEREEKLRTKTLADYESEIVKVILVAIVVVGIVFLFIYLQNHQGSTSSE